MDTNTPRYTDPERRTKDNRYRRTVVWRGQERTVISLCKETGVNYATALERIDDLGWTVEAAFTTPVRKYRRKQKPLQPAFGAHTR